MTLAELKQLLQQAKAENATELDLDLSRQNLDELPDEIGELTNLQSLNLSRNQLTALPESLGNLTNLQALELSHTQLADLPEWLSRLTNLQVLVLSDNQLTSLPEWLGQLRNLRGLSLLDNHLTTLPEWLGRLTSLQSLNLQGNQLSTLPEALGQLTNLQHLNLAEIPLTALPEWLGKLATLRMLNLSGNPLTVLPEWLGRLTSLQMLYLRRNQLTALPESLGQLTNLQRLDLAQNQLTALPEVLRKLTNLRQLYLRNNQLTVFPHWLVQMANFDHDFESDFPNATEEDAKENPWKAKYAIDLRGNPIPNIPPEILDWAHKPKYILEYVRALEAQPVRQPLNEAKVLFVGQGGVGKTSLIKRLRQDAFDPHEAKTDGIAIQTHTFAQNGRDIKLKLWDFGGQEIMHATHQFFLTARSLYVLVYDSRQEEAYGNVEHWLKVIRSFGNQAPLLVVLNKIDEHHKSINERGLQEKYPNIKGFIKTSCRTGAGLAELRAAIEHEAAQLPHLGYEWLQSWLDAKSALESLDKDYISYERYTDICAERGVPPAHQEFLIQYLHDLGVVLNYRNDKRLQDVSVLNPHWVTEGVYAILNCKKLQDRHGTFHINDLDAILDPARYPANKHYFIVDMMRKFQLCFPLTDAPDSYLLPDLLPPQQPELDWSPTSSTGSGQGFLSFQYHYDYLPKSVISRFIVLAHQWIADKIYWQTGVGLRHKDNEALVKADLADRRIFIYVRGREQERRFFLFHIRALFEQIHKSIEGLQPQEMVGLPDPSTGSGQTGIVVPYEHLLNLEEMGQMEFVPQGAKKLYKVRELLNGVRVERDLFMRQEKLDIYQRECELLLDKLGRLRKAKVIADGETKKFELDKEIERAERELSDVEEKLRTVDGIN